MKTTLELPDALVKKVKLHALEMGQKLKDTVADLLEVGLSASERRRSKPGASMLKRRRALTRKFVSGEWGLELTGYEEGRAAERRKAAERSKAWRE